MHICTVCGGLEKTLFCELECCAWLATSTAPAPTAPSLDSVSEPSAPPLEQLTGPLIRQRRVMCSTRSCSGGNCIYHRCAIVWCTKKRVRERSYCAVHLCIANDFDSIQCNEPSRLMSHFCIKHNTRPEIVRMCKWGNNSHMDIIECDLVWYKVYPQSNGLYAVRNLRQLNGLLLLASYKARDVLDAESVIIRRMIRMEEYSDRLIYYLYDETLIELEISNIKERRNVMKLVKLIKTTPLKYLSAAGIAYT